MARSVSSESWTSLGARLLVGAGALFAALPAQGSVVVGNLEFTDVLVTLDANSGGFFMPGSLADSLAGGSAVHPSCSLTQSAVTSTGFSITAASDGVGVWTVYEASYTFTALSNMTAVLSGDTAAEGALIFMYDWTAQQAVFVRFEGASGSWTSGALALVQGHQYSLQVNPGGAALGSSETGTVVSFSVPAPGALAFLGVAGLVGTRRRR